MSKRHSRMLRWQRAAAVVAAVLVLAVGQAALACPSCKLAAGDESSSLARGYFWSILFMLSMPPLILGSLGLYFYSMVRKARLAQGVGHSRTLVPAAMAAEGGAAGLCDDAAHDGAALGPAATDSCASQPDQTVGSALCDNASQRGTSRRLLQVR
jgi:hypothetical protein